MGIWFFSSHMLSVGYLISYLLSVNKYYSGHIFDTLFFQELCCHSLCGSSYNHFVTIIPKWRTTKTVIHWLWLYQVKSGISSRGWYGRCITVFMIYMCYFMSWNCVISEIWADDFFTRLIVTDRLAFDPMIATALSGWYKRTLMIVTHVWW